MRAKGFRYRYCPKCKTLKQFAKKGIGKGRGRKDWRCFDCRLGVPLPGSDDPKSMNFTGNDPVGKMKAGGEIN
jgi:hypothetical protein